MYTEKIEMVKGDGKTEDLVRWDTTKKYTKEELRIQRDEFEQAAKSGKIISLTDLMINHGL